MIDLSIDGKGLEHAVAAARERNLVIPTFAQQRDPVLAPARIRERLARTGLWDIAAPNLFRITWKNEPTLAGGGFGPVNALEFLPSLTGVPARIVALVGKWFPTGAHKVGATFGCLAPRLVTGQFDPTYHKAAWPSTGNFCRGGAFNCAILGCGSIAILPDGMSRERFKWLQSVAGEIITTSGCESNVKEIFDKCHELRGARPEVVVFDQFEEFGNHLWHYAVTGRAMEEVLDRCMRPGDTYRGVALTLGSAGAIGCADYLKEMFPTSKVCASEALQCPTLLRNGFGDHRIEGIGDKNVSWIHHVQNTDLVAGIDDEACLSLLRLFNEPAGRAYLSRQGVPEALISQLDLAGISGIANLLTAIKLAKWYELGENDVILTVLTDSLDMYRSRLAEQREKRGEYRATDAAADYARYLLGCGTDNMEELGYWDRKRIHNLKYYTWVEQQGRTCEELQAQWYDRHYWKRIHEQVDDIDCLIAEFNERTGLLKDD